MALDLDGSWPMGVAGAKDTLRLGEGSAAALACAPEVEVRTASKPCSRASSAAAGVTAAGVKAAGRRSGAGSSSAGWLPARTSFSTGGAGSRLSSGDRGCSGTRGLKGRSGLILRLGSALDPGSRPADCRGGAGMAAGSGAGSSASEASDCLRDSSSEKRCDGGSCRWMPRGREMRRGCAVGSLLKSGLTSEGTAGPCCGMPAGRTLICPAG